jgi:chaperonin GroEL (HSP60 family)
MVFENCAADIADVFIDRAVPEDAEKILKMIFVEKCKDPHSVAILIRAGLERMVDEAERAMTDALSVVSDVVENNKIVAGGGADGANSHRLREGPRPAQ